MNKVNKVLGAISCTLGLGIAGAIMVGASQTPQAAAANTSSVSRIERIVHYSDISKSGIYAVCHDGHEFLVTAYHTITVTQVMDDAYYSLEPKKC